MIDKISFVDFNYLKKSFLKDEKNISHKLDEQYIVFKKEYYKDSFFENISFKVEYENSKVVCPLTIQSEKKKKKLNFFGDDILVFTNNKISKNLDLKLKELFKNLKSKYMIDEITFKVPKNEKNIESAKKNVEKIKSDIFIDLTLNKTELLNNFKPNLRNELKKKYNNTQYEIIDYKNFRDKDIKEMMHMHKKVSGKITRSEKTWNINGEMIKNKKAFIVKVSYEDNPISFSFFYHNHLTCTYFSSCSLREYFKIIKNLQHRAIYHAIEYSKSISKNLYLGSSTIFSKNNIDEKVLNIEKFKSKFLTKKNYFAIYNDIPDTFMNY